MACQYCDYPGGIKTYEHQVCMPIDRKLIRVDYCIHRLVAVLNASGIDTVASCCGHGKMPGRIDLQGGSVLTITHGTVTSENPMFVHTKLQPMKEAIVENAKAQRKEIAENAKYYYPV